MFLNKGIMLSKRTLPNKSNTSRVYDLFIIQRDYFHLSGDILPPFLFFIHLSLLLYLVLFVFIPLEKFSFVWRRHHCQQGPSTFALCLAKIWFMPIEQWGFCSMLHILSHGSITKLLVVEQPLLGFDAGIQKFNLPYAKQTEPLRQLLNLFWT